MSTALHRYLTIISVSALKRCSSGLRSLIQEDTGTCLNKGKHAILFSKKDLFQNLLAEISILTLVKGMFYFIFCSKITINVLARPQTIKFYHIWKMSFQTGSKLCAIVQYATYVLVVLLNTTEFQNQISLLRIQFILS